MGCDVDPRHLGLPGVGLEQRGEDADGSGLAGAVWAQDAQHRTGFHVEVEAIEGPYLSVVLGQVLGPNHGFHSFSLSSRLSSVSDRRPAGNSSVGNRKINSCQKAAAISGNLRNMGDTTARALRLLSLLQARRWWTGAELRERLSVSERSLRRDVERLRALGYPIEATPGPAGGYRLGAGAEMPPLLLDEEEAVAMAVGLRTAALGGIAGMEDASVRALAKLEQVVPPRVWHDVALFRSLPVADGGSQPQAEVGPLLTVARACRDGERIRFHYRSRQGEETERHVEPHHLVMVYRRWYLLAFDRDRDDWRTFRVDRMGETWATGMR